MKRNPVSQSGLFNLRVCVALTLCSVGVLLAMFSFAAAPPIGTLTPTGPMPPWDGAWVGTAPGGASPEGETSCVEGVTCETFRLTLSGTPADWVGQQAHIVISVGGDPELTDYDVYIHKGESIDALGRPNGPLAGSSADGGTPPEVVDLDPNNPAVGTGVFLVHVVYWLASGVTDQYSGNASVLGGGEPTPTPTPSPTPSSTPAAGTPRFFNYYAPPGVAEDAGEPTIGVNWLSEQSFSNNDIVTGNPNPPIANGGTANYYGGFLNFMLRVRFNDCSSPAIAPFEQMPVTLPGLPRVFGDPILATDHFTGRTFVAQLEGLTPFGSTMEFTDDDGDTFFPSEGAGPSCIDHQTIGAGPFHEPLPPGLLYPNAVYYASQCIADATSQLSVDGGITFPIQTVMFTAADCAGLHGHIKIAEDGTAFVPDKACASGGVPLLLGGKAAVVVSENNGLTWDIRPVDIGADTSGSNDDPSVGVSWCPPGPFPCDKAARSNVIYLGYQAEDGSPRIARSNDRGLTWQYDKPIGVDVGIRHCAFPAVVVGDPDRAAFAFFGTTTEGNYDQPAFPGVWYLYVATTLDGENWTTQNITPNDPIQRGGICGDGACRNLLDFFDATIDKRGRVVIAGEDGCIGGCVNGGPNSFTAKAFISRQAGGKRMFSVFDPVEPGVPGAPKVDGNIDSPPTRAVLSWPVPDNAGSPITAYKVYRAPAAGGPFSLLATVPVNNYTDTALLADNYYRVTAVNAIGEGPFCQTFHPVTVEVPDPCELPGVLVSNDLNPDGSDNDSGVNTPLDPRVNARQLFVAEPFVSEGVEQFFFTLQVAPSTQNSAPPNSQWFIVWNRQMPDATHDRWYTAMRTDASGTPSFEYGKFGVPLDPLNPSQTANTPLPLGPADDGSFYDPLTGVIRILLSKSKAENVPVGNDLAGVNVRTYFNRPDPGQRSQNNASDITPDGSYSVVGNASCAPTPSPTPTPTPSPTPTATPSASPTPSGTPTATPSPTPTSTPTPSPCSGTAVEDDDPHIAYSNGWHLINNQGASAGHFRLNQGGNDQHSAILTFTTPANQTGTITYFYATSRQGGSAEVFLDNQAVGTVNYNGPSGSNRSPIFGASVNYNYGGTANGQHMLEIRPVRGGIYIDGFCIGNATPTGTPASHPGGTSEMNLNLSPGEVSLNNLTLGAGTQAISVGAETSVGVPIQLALIDPGGLVLRTESNSSGVVVLEAPITQSGIYVIRVVNLSLGAVQVWSVATPLVSTP